MSEEMLTVETPFGTFEMQPDEVVAFPGGLPGFEECRRFVLLSHATHAPLRCLHAIDGQRASFLAVDPCTVAPDYQCVLPPEAQGRVDAREDTRLVWLVLVALSDGDETPTANLRAPIVINPASMLGCQFVIDDDRYPVRLELAA